MFEPKDKQLAWLKRNIKFELNEYELKEYEKIYAFRNCVVHNDSILNSKHIEKIKEVQKANPYIEEQDLGGMAAKIPLSITITDFTRTFNYLTYCGYKMILAFWEHISKSEIIFILSATFYIKYTNDKHYYISGLLFENLLESKIDRNDADQISATLGYCVSLKNSPESKLGLKILSEINWTDLSEEILILKYGIEDDVDGVVNCMKVLVKNITVNFLSEEYPIKYFLKWGFFDDVREDPKFVKTYEEIFKGPQTTYVRSSEMFPEV
jgi:hypothetical protein